MSTSADRSDEGVHILPEAAALPIQSGKSLLELCLAHRIPLTHACGGLARCSICRVVVLDGVEFCTARNEAERELAERLGFDDCVRLACQTRISGPAQIRRLVLDDHDEDFVEEAGPRGEIAALGEEIVAAILFCDIRGFTPFTRRVMPYDAIHTLNRFYATLGPQITKHGGEINNTMGDGFLAIFPQADEHTACLAAVEAGLALLGAMQPLHDYAMRAYGEPLRIGVGIHSGPVIIGSIGHGGARRMTVIGDNVNVASRIESATKQLGRPLLVSPRVRELLSADHEWQEAGIATLPGIADPMPLHSLASAI
jgi:adenylate cyclase